MSSTPYTIELLYFGRLREQVRIDRERVQLPPEVRTLQDLRAWLCHRPVFAQAFGSISGIRGAVDQRVVNDSTPLRDGAEVAFFPPVTGG
jgi:molybdopterin synthase sulfur carrier subunit